ncbi:MAG: glycosyltransferase [Promethearchaeota archaeon]
MLSLFIPAFNEAAILENSIVQLIGHIDKLKKDYEIYIVDDTSTDNTKQIVKGLIKKYKPIKYLYFKNGPSRRENLALAFRKANHNIIGFIDADIIPYVSESSLRKTLRNLQSADIIIGSRYAGIRPKRNPWRLIISKSYNILLRFLFKSRIKDHQCGFKFFKKRKLFFLLDKLGYDYSLKRGWFWDAELLIIAQKLGFRIKEIPINWEEGKKTSFKLQREAKIIMYIIKNFRKIKNITPNYNLKSLSSG